MTKQELIDRLVAAVDAGAMSFQINKIINEYNVANYRPDGYKEIVKLYACEAYNISPADFNKETSKHKYVNARSLYCHILSRKVSNGKRVYPDKELANDIYRDRSSVYLKLRKLDGWLGFDPAYTSIYNATVSKIKNHIDKIKQDEEQ